MTLINILELLLFLFLESVALIAPVVLVIYILHRYRQKEREHTVVWKILAQSLGYTYSKEGSWSGFSSFKLFEGGHSKKCTMLFLVKEKTSP